MARRALHHLAFRTRDLPRLAAFYRDVLCLETRPGGREGQSVWLALGEGLLMIELADEGEPSLPEGSLELLALRCERDETQTFRARLDAAGVTIEATTRFTVYFRDPDGRRVALSHHPDEPLV